MPAQEEQALQQEREFSLHKNDGQKHSCGKSFLVLLFFSVLFIPGPNITI